MDRIGAVHVELVVPLNPCTSYDEGHRALGSCRIVYLYADSLVRDSGTGSFYVVANAIGFTLVRLN